MPVNFPLFPLKIVVFPNEKLNLHIFEPRYKQLINDCVENKSNFVIPAYIHEKIELGTEVSINKIEKIYSDGKMDVSTTGVNVVNVLSFNNPQEGKLYAGGEIEVLENIDDSNGSQKYELTALLNELFSKINANLTIEIDDSVSTHLIAHKIGLSLKQEYSLLGMTRESERCDFIISHLSEAIPILDQMNQTKERIKMNGHFKHFDPLDF